MAHILAVLLRLSFWGSLPAGLLLLLRPVLRGRVSQAVPYYLWLLVLLRLCIPVGITLPLPAPAEAAPAVSAAPVLSGAANPPAHHTSPEIPAPPVPPPAKFAGAPSAPSTAAERSASLCTVLWGVGALASLSWYAGGYLRFVRRAQRTVREAPAEALAVLRALDPAGRVRLAQCSAVHTPVLSGVLRPVILLPAGVEADRLRDILLHELTHAKRHDLLYKWFAAAVSSLHWFNPLMILVRRAISRACELSCDEAVIRTMDAGQRRHYGETLLALAAVSSGSGPLAATLCEEKAQLKERLVSIVHNRKKGAAAALASLLLILAAGGCTLVSGAEVRAADHPAAAVPPPVVSLLPDGPEAPLETVPGVPRPLTPARAAYAAVLMGLVKDGVFPDGTPGRGGTPNQFSICDMDGDGAEELVICYTSAIMAGQLGVIYGFDGETGTVYEELSGFPDFTFYSNGAVQEGWSHNQGFAGENFWPYRLWRYDPETDTYAGAGAVDAWDRNRMESGFPAALDEDGDGMLYQLFFTEEDWRRYQDPEAYVDGAVYRAWRDACLEGAEAVEIPYSDLTQENAAALTGGGEPYAFYVQVAGSRTLTVGLETSQPGADYFAVDKIRVYDNQTLIQTIETADLPVPEDYAWDGLFVNRGYVVGEPDVRDLNFDGAEDFGLLAVDGYPHNVPYTYFLWNEAENRFDPAFTLFGSLALETDPVHGRLLEFFRDGAAGSSVSYYAYKPDGSLQPIQLPE